MDMPESQLNFVATQTPPGVEGEGDATKAIPASSEKLAMDMAESQVNCTATPTPTQTPLGVEGEGDATYTMIPLVPKIFGLNLTDWEVFMFSYRIDHHFRTNPETDASTKVVVKDLPEYIREEDLWRMFSFFGRIAKLVLLRDPTTTSIPLRHPPRGKSHCCAYVYFLKFDDAAKSVEALNRIKYDKDHKEWSVEIVTKNRPVENLDVDKPEKSKIVQDSVKMTKGSEPFSCSQLDPMITV